jgi:hypothetical protein
MIRPENGGEESPGFERFKDRSDGAIAGSAQRGLFGDTSGLTARGKRQNIWRQHSELLTETKMPGTRSGVAAHGIKKNAKRPREKSAEKEPSLNGTYAKNSSKNENTGQTPTGWRSVIIQEIAGVASEKLAIFRQRIAFLGVVDHSTASLPVEPSAILGQ